MGFNKSRAAKEHKTEEHLSNPRENSDRNQQVLGASDMVAECSEMVDPFERLIVLYSAFRAFLYLHDSRMPRAFHRTSVTKDPSVMTTSSCTL